MNKVKDPSIRRHSNRLPHYDYAQEGAYFIIIVTQNRLCLFGSILDGEMVLNDAGRMGEQVCQELSQVIRGVEIGCYQIMPNHFHAIIWLTQDGGAEIFEDGEINVGADLRVCPGQPQRVAPTKDLHPDNNEIIERENISVPTENTGNSGNQGIKINLFSVVQRFKSLTTRRYIEGVRHYGWPHFHDRLWQRNYYEHVIRDEVDLETITDYILQNPLNWGDDEEFQD